jgi:alpha-N-acetylglucosaminidase
MQFHWFGSFMANSYTQAFWVWERWEAHLDWCALMGFDLVMVYEGAEHVHAAVYEEMGVTEEELGSFFSGAAFLGWSRCSLFTFLWGNSLSLSLAHAPSPLAPSLTPSFPLSNT